jgi:hypothetical protein
MWLFLTVLLGC